MSERPAIRRSLLPLLLWVLVFHLFLSESSSGAILQDTVEQTYDLSPTAQLTIRNTDGRIYVYGSELPKLKVKAIRRAFSKERLEAIKFALSVNGESATLDTIYPPAPPAGSLFADRSGTVDYVIIVPQTCTLSKVELNSGEIIVEGMRGPSVDVQLGTGLLFLNDCFTAVRANVREGGIEASYGWWESDRFSLSAETTGGDLRVNLPVNAALHIDAASTEGTIRNLFSGEPDGDDVRALDRVIGVNSSAVFTLRATRGNIKILRIR